VKLLLDNLGYARKVWTKGNCNALQRLGEIIDHMNNTLKIPWNGGNPVETGFLEERGWIPLEIAKRRRGELQDRLKSP
jgi:hypothetical protein